MSFTAYTIAIEYLCCNYVCRNLNKAHTLGDVDKIADGDKAVFQFKESYEDQELTKYKSLRVKLRYPYTI